ncbi:MAG: YlmC/YmxH family sporulation protein [Clostridiales bacterium]|jgi:YlmC/YmxH family sporulation protein
MRLSELIGKDIINLQNGGRLGMAADSDLLIQEETGIIESIILPGRGSFLGLWEKDALTVPWSAVKKIGSEVIIMDLDETIPRR